MPKLIKIIIATLFITVPVYSFAKSSNAQGQGSQGSGVSSQNQVQTQNAGDNQQLQVSTQEEASGIDSKGKVLRINEKANEVSKYVQTLLDMPDRNGNIGQQVKEIAKAQNQSQEKVMEKVQKMEQRGTLARFLFGPKGEDIDQIKEELKQNQERAQTLRDLKLQLLDSTDQDIVQALIDSLTAQDVALTQKVMDEQSAFSLLGALKALFSSK